MRKFIILTFIFFISSIIHWALASAFVSFNIGVSFMFAAACSVCMMFPKWSGYTFAFFGGLFLDFFGVNMFGGYALTFTVCAAIIYLVKMKMDLELVLSQSVLIFILSIFSTLFYNFVGIVFLKGTAWHGFESLFLGSLINALVAPFVFYVLLVARAIALPGNKR